MREKVPIFIMMVGISGSGKSTEAIKLSKRYKAIIISPDRIREKNTGNMSDQSKNDIVFKIAKRNAIYFLSKGRNVILDATNLESTYRKEFVKDLPNCTLKAKICKVDVRTAIKRIRNDIRIGKNRSNVPIEILKRQNYFFKRDAKKLEKEGFTLIL